jgi:DNA-directed RNA polymerase specialized sigma24 family protein
MEEWLAALDRDDTTAAWDLFLSRYRRLIFAAVRHYAQDYDEVMDVFVRVCEALREDDLRRLRTWHEQPEHRARFSTWLVTVVRNLSIDWFRRREGRRRLPAAAEALPACQRRIFELVFLDGRSHVEAYELLRTSDEPAMTFAEFLRELHAVHRAVSDGRRGSLLRELHPIVPVQTPPDAASTVEAVEREAILENALAALSEDDRLAVQLYVVEQLPASDVARIVGLPNAKSVYNRVYRALADIRSRFAKAGLGSGDI